MSEQVVSLLQVLHERTLSGPVLHRAGTTDYRIMRQSNLAAAAAAEYSRVSRVFPGGSHGEPYEALAPLPAEVTHGSLVDPHDDTLETEITEEMVSLALEAMDDQQIWPYAADRGLIAQPVRTAQIIRFPGC